MSALCYGGYAFLYLPLVLIIVYSFNASETTQWQGFSFQWYRSLAQNADLLQATFMSLKIAFLAATLSVLLGTVCAYMWNESHLKLGIMASLPLVIPEMVMGLAILMLFVCLRDMWGWNQNRFLMVVATHTTLGAAYATEMIKSRLNSIDPDLQEAAMDLGASRKKTFFLVTLPLITPSIIASWLIAFLLSFDDVILASFTSGPGITTLPLFIFSSMKLGYTPQINALATCIVLATIPLILAMTYIYRNKPHKKSANQ